MNGTTQTKTVVWMLAAMTVLSPLAAAAPRDALLDSIPSDAMFCVRINQLNTTMGALDQYLLGASPLPISLAMLVNMQLAGIVGDPTLSGIDINGTFMAAGIVLEDGSFNMSIIVPMTDYAAFIKDNPACSPSDTPGVTLFRSAQPSVGTLALMPAPAGKYALVNSEGQTDALVVMHRQMAAQTAKLASRLDAEQAAQATQAPAWLYVNLNRFFELYGPAFVEGFSGMMAQMPAELGIADIMDMYGKLLTAVVKEAPAQADSYTLALTPEPAALKLDAAFRARPGSDLAGMLVEDPQAPQNFAMAGYSDDDAAVNAVFKTNRIMNEKLTGLAMGFVQELFGGKFTSGDIEQLNALIDKSVKTSGKETFISFSYGPGQPPFSMRQVQETSAAPAEYHAMMRQGADVANCFYNAMGLPFRLGWQQGAETYKNVAIDSFTIAFESPDQENPMTEAISQMYGKEGMSYYVARKDNLVLTTFGPDAKEDIKTLIDTPADKSKTPAGELQKAMTILGPDAVKADMVGSINILKLARGFMDMAQQMGETMDQMEQEEAGMLSFLASAANVPTQSCMAFSGKTAGGKSAVRLVLPKQHLAEIINVAMQIQMQMMLQNQNSETGDDMTMQPAPASPFAVPPVSAADPQDPLQKWVGKPAPDVKLTDIGGNTVSIAGLNGKKIILAFWATWCPPCKEMVPNFIALRQSASPDRLAILGVSSEPADRIRSFADANNINYPVISHAGALPDPYGQIIGMPTTFFIDSAGTIRYVLVGYHDKSEIQAALNGMN